MTKSVPSDNIMLTELTKKSKAYWGYSENQIKEWTTELTITAKYISENEVYKLLLEGKLVAYYSYLKIGEGVVKLDNLFVLPEYIGNKVGSFLLKDFLSRVKEEGFNKIVTDAEPNAEKFYQKFGFVLVDKKESSMRNRFIPIMELRT